VRVAHLRVARVALQGEARPAPRDIDLLVVGDEHDLDANRIYAFAETASERLAREVNVTVISEDEWRSADTGFLDMIRERPLLRLAG
jgi:hypothetical protein